MIDRPDVACRSGVSVAGGGPCHSGRAFYTPLIIGSFCGLVLGLVPMVSWAASLQGPASPTRELAPPSTGAGNPHGHEVTVTRPAASPEIDSASRNVAARARMLECGHQWSSMKRAGTAAGTWKEFSRGCLALK